MLSKENLLLSEIQNSEYVKPQLHKIVLQGKAQVIGHTNATVTDIGTGSSGGGGGTGSGTGGGATVAEPTPRVILP